LPVKTLKLLSKVLKDKSVNDMDAVKMAIHTTVMENQHTSGAVQFQCNDVTLFSGLVRGRFPKWRSIMPQTENRLQVRTLCDPLRSAVNQLVTSEREPGVLFTLG
jgi:DNA polymerase III sliding clamp (beta) subunit (PCNA family)